MKTTLTFHISPRVNAVPTDEERAGIVPAVQQHIRGEAPGLSLTATIGSAEPMGKHFTFVVKIDGPDQDRLEFGAIELVHKIQNQQRKNYTVKGRFADKSLRVRGAHVLKHYSKRGR